MRKLVYTMFISNNRALFHLRWKENLVKHQRVSKYYENGCGFSNHIVFEVFNFSITKLNIYVGEATVSSSRCLAILFQNRQAVLFFINGTVTAVIELSQAFYLFESHSKNRQKLEDSDGIVNAAEVLKIRACLKLCRSCTFRVATLEKAVLPVIIFRYWSWQHEGSNISDK